MLNRIGAVAGAVAMTAGLAVAAGPAGARYSAYDAGSDAPPTTTYVVEQDDKPPVDKDGNQSCSGPDGVGGSEWYPHGTVYTRTTTRSDGSVITYSFRCDNGRWRPVDHASGSSQYLQPGTSYYAFEPGP